VILPQLQINRQIFAAIDSYLSPFFARNWFVACFSRQNYRIGKVTVDISKGYTIRTKTGESESRIRQDLRSGTIDFDILPLDPFQPQGEGKSELESYGPVTASFGYARSVA
jgi:hypothetical protein